jgi:ubiquitin-like 1-activating enzyme E1 B
MAGNIIPAIATTNAIVAGLCVLQARHVLAGTLDQARMVFLARRPEHVFIAEPLRPPNPLCQVCGIIRCELKCAPNTPLRQIVDMLHDDLGYGEEISLLGEGGRLLYDVDFDDLLEKGMGDVGLVEGRTLTIVDEESERVNLEFIISEHTEFIVPVVPTIPTKPPQAKEIVENGVEMDGIENGNGEGGKKRVREDDDDNGGFRKKARVAEEGDVIVIDEDDDMIMID